MPSGVLFFLFSLNIILIGSHLLGTATETDLKDLLNELEIMASVGHHNNVIDLIGVCASGGKYWDLDSPPGLCSVVYQRLQRIMGSYKKYLRLNPYQEVIH